MDDKSTTRLEVKPSLNGTTKKLPTTVVGHPQTNGNSLSIQKSQSNASLGSSGPAPANSIVSNKSSAPANQTEQPKLISKQTPSQIQPQIQNNNHHVKPKGKNSGIPHKQHQNIRQHPLNIAPKYAKIQPAIAPKPSSSTPMTTKFNPIPSSKFQLQMKQTLAQDATSLNTSKRWILPPRPRPGRKPTGGECDKVTKNQVNGIKRKPKPKSEASSKDNDVKDELEKTTVRTSSTTTTTAAATSTSISVKKEFGTGSSTTVDQINGRGKAVISKSKDPVPSGTTQPLATESRLEQTATPSPPTKTVAAVKPTTKRETTSDGVAVQSEQKLSSKLSLPSPLPPPPPPIKSEDPNVQISELKLSYLSKLKEQEIIRNYVEVLTKQIKELSFVQNGVITFDALKNNSKVSPNSQRITSTLTKSKCDQLDSINNLNDLNKFLTYLSKSSDIIKSAKRQPSESITTTSDGLNQQIDSYVQLRNRFKLLNQTNGKSTNKKKMNKRSGDTSTGAKQKNSSTPVSVTTPKHTSPKQPFTPDLLRPLNASNLFTDPNLDLMEMDLQTETIEASPSTAEILTNDDKIKSTGDSLSLDYEANKYGACSEDNDADFFHVDEHDFLSRLVLDDSTPIEETELGEVMIHNNNEEKNNDATANEVNTQEGGSSKIEVVKGNSINNDTIMKKKMKFNCGFCTNDTPCLCFDSDLEISRLN
ncbi:hypothetical protein CANMA_004981 [Candida margitis]|uniref:uncharacterized protein n=1 Tax=Candida margitis TaxID=1775924 RepID=UPI002226C17D|nr:uncharacterized protein CANMA_004981 [Candida margitis]KAI5954142.1 hypothetical protein CANMA_004981 [Candida margitis]